MTSATADLCSPFLQALGMTGASIAVLDGSGNHSTICSSDATAARLDELQFDLGEGPQWEAVRTAEPVLVPSIADASHDDWPVFGNALRNLEVSALFAFPLVLGAVTVGAVGLYRTEIGGLSSRDVSAATAMASAVAGSAVRRAMAAAGDDSYEETAIAPAMRREVHQATGMILVQLDTTATIAYSRLQAYAFANGRTVQDVAHDVVTRKLNFRSQPD